MSTTVGALLADCALELAPIGPSARDEASRIIAQVVNLGRAAVFAYGERIVDEADAAQIRAHTARRAAGEPLPYIFGEAWFYGYRLTVNDAVLVPRAETEHLVDEILTHAAHARRICDVGTGSGAITIALSHALPAAVVTAIDISPSALVVAEANVAAHKLESRVRCLQSDLLAELGVGRSPANREFCGPFDVVVANLPYIPSPDVPSKPDPVGFEPRLALDGGPSGIELYERLLQSLPEFLAPGALLLCEAAPPTMRALEALFEHYLPRRKRTTGRDYAGLERYILCHADVTQP